jgi:phosphatidylinositol kinase/protein kinase (PI-3  family)|eukprot:COSAG02_NODE_2300_length_9188_cov_57.987787_4_plen_253_part_00
MLQLSQLMKLEENLSDSPLAALLMYRALRNPTLIGQSLYWSIRSELYNSSVYTHLSLYLRQYMDHCGTHRQELANQERLMGQLRNTIRHIKSERQRRKAAGEDYSIHVLKEVLHADMAEIEFPPEGIRMPVNPNLRCRAVKVESCKVMGSHQVPLWLVFDNYDPTAAPVYIIFKDGDDVRQDTLVLQLFNIMQDTWEDDGLDIPLRPGTTGTYGCVSVGFEVGVVEVVTHCNTLAGIVKEAEKSALGVFDKV